ncbi:MAG: SRPBCC domain-containing protein [Thalassovita sp.]
MRLSFDPARDLEIDRVIVASSASIWRCWTEADLLKKWFTPKPVQVQDARINPTPGGEFFTRLALPSGKVLENNGCVLVAQPERLLVFTDSLTEGFHPSKTSFLTTTILLTPDVVGTRYVARGLHHSPERRQDNENMGFFDGWGRAIDQLQELARSLDVS